jgi:Ala-tRNA(Pro) deacylase
VVDCKERLEDFLRENRVPFEAHHHPRAVTAQEVAASEHVPGKLLAKTVMVLADGEMWSCWPCPPRTRWTLRKVDLEKAAAALGVKVARLAEEEEFEDTFPVCEVGAMPPFGNLYGVAVYVEETLAEDETIVFRSGTHTETMRVRYSDFEWLVEPTEAQFARRN